MKKIAGFTFTELMTALVINTLLFAGLIAVVVANLDHYHRTVNTSRLNQQLQAAMSVMVNDIRRAGYWANASSDIGLHQNNNPFMTSGTDVAISGNCILLSYDYNKNNSIPTISSASNDERFGFRVDNQILQARPPGATFSCTAPASEWENMTDINSLRITNLTFTMSQSNLAVGPGTKAILMRSIDVTLTGQLANDTTVTRTLTQHVRIRNDKLIP